jgi:hypothetical protein
MDDFDLPEPNPRYMGNVRCLRCGRVFGDDLLDLNPVTNRWCCKDWPTCEGSGVDIEIADGRRNADGDTPIEDLDYDPSNPPSPPAVPVLVRCVTCLEFYMSNEMRNVDGIWVCKFWPKCEGDGYKLNILDPDDHVFRLVRNRSAYRKRSR